MSHDGYDAGVQERPVWIPARRADLFGVLTTPPGAARRVGVVLLPAAGPTPSVDRNRLYVVLARRLGASGFCVVRIDYRGTGESSGTTAGITMSRPCTGDLLATVGALRNQGLDRFIVIGRCFGARVALVAAGRIRGLCGLGLMSMPWYWERADIRRVLPAALRPELLMGLLDRRRRRHCLRVLYHYTRRRWAVRPWSPRRDDPVWIDPALPDGLRRAVRNEVSLLFVCGASDRDYEELCEVRAGRTVGPLLRRAGERVRITTVPGNTGDVHHLLTVAAQEAIVRHLEEWIRSLAPPRTGDPGGRHWWADDAIRLEGRGNCRSPDQ